MSDLISREALVDKTEILYQHTESGKIIPWSAVRVCEISNIPTVEAEPVRHGGHVVWKNRFMGGFVPDITITDRSGEKHTGTLDTTHYELVPYCSECGKELGVSSLAYCPNCGEKMDGGAEDEHKGT